MLRILLSLFFCISLQAQEVLELKGRVLNDTIAKTALTVINLSMQKGAITNAAGEFTITARKLDTLFLSAVQYESRQFVVSEQIFNKGSVSLYLVPKVSELDEVFLNNSVLSGTLGQDASHKLLLDDLDAIEKADKAGLIRDAPKKTIEERRLYTATSGTGEIDINFVTVTKIPLQGLINRISGKRKRLKKQLEVANYEKDVQKIKANFSYDFYLETLGIQEASIDDFISYLIMDHNLLGMGITDKLVLLEFMQARAIGYLKLTSGQDDIKNN